MGRTKYDVFISYRRTAYDTANLIAVKLRHAGYRVFFDVDTLTAGKFNEQLLEVIRNCKDFILVLPENALDRCDQPDDWIRREVVCAMESRRNIIPIMLDGFSWPEIIPDEMKELVNYQAITAVGHEYFDMAVERLQGYLKSSPQKPVRKWLTMAGIVLGVVAVILLVVYGGVRHIVNVTCDEIGTKESTAMNIMDMLGQDNKMIKEELQSFYSNIDRAKNDEDRADFEQDLEDLLKIVEKNVASYQKTFPAPVFEFNSTENYVLAYYNIEKEDLAAFTLFYNSMFDSMNDILEIVRTMKEQHTYSQLERDHVALSVNCFEHYNNAFYYGYMSSLSLLPKSARKKHFTLAKKWKSFPNGTPFDLTQEEYEQFQTQELGRCEEESQRFQAALNYSEQHLNELEQRLQDLEKKATAQ